MKETDHSFTREREKTSLNKREEGVNLEMDQPYVPSLSLSNTIAQSVTTSVILKIVSLSLSPFPASWNKCRNT